jgi:hypothetical protein
MVVRPPSPEASESEDGGESTRVPEWQLRDWDDDYYFPEDAGGAGGGGSGADPFATWICTVDDSGRGSTWNDSGRGNTGRYCMLYNIT